MENRRILIGIGAVIIVLAGFLIAINWNSEEAEDTNGTDEAPTNAYINEEYGFSFERLEGYMTVEAEDPEAGRYSLVLSRDEDSQVPENGEGPTAITVDVFEDPEEGNLMAWLEGNEISNYSLRTGEAAETAVDGEEAVAYGWDGLYLGRSVALMHQGNVILISGTYLERSDPIYSDFDRVVSSFELR